MGHKERAHALFRTVQRAPMARVPGQRPAGEGNARHGIRKRGGRDAGARTRAEMKVVNYFYPKEISKRSLNAAIKKMKENEIRDDEMLGHTDAYIDYIRDTSLGPSQSAAHGCRAQMGLWPLHAAWI